MIFCLFTYKYIFNFTSILWDILQTKNLDIQFCQNQININIQNIGNLRTDLHAQKVYDETSGVASPIVRRKRQIDGDIPNQLIQYRSLYFQIIDNVINQMSLRFNDFEKLSFLNLLNVENFKTCKSNFPVKEFQLKKF